MTEPPTRSGRLRRLVPWLVAAVIAGAGVVVITSPSHAAGPLRANAATRGKFIGFAGAANLLCNNTATCTSGSDATYRNLGITEFNQVTPENAMKWDATEPNQNQFTFTQADGIVAFAAANNQIVHGHTLVWHSQTPGWVQGLNATAMRAALQNHIQTVVGRYANNAALKSWDVVNEVFNEDGTLRQSFWLNTLGSGYIADAFRMARAADSDADLCINDYNVESANAKSNGLFNLVQSLLSQGVPVTCVGLQAHLGVQFGAPSGIQSQIQRYASLGLKVRISELDIRMLNPEDSTKDAQQASFYTQVVNACNAVTLCGGITLWGIDDGHSWIPGTFSDQCCGLLWTSSYQQKPAYTAVSNALAGGTGGDTQAPTVPGTPTSSNVTSSSVTLSWTASTDNVGVTGYDIFRAPGASGGTFASVGTSTSNSFTNTGLTASTTFRYQVRARDAAGNLSAFSAPVTVTTSPATGDTQAPTVPGTPVASGITSSSVNLSWTASTDNVGVTGYDIFRAPGASGGTFASVGTSTTASFSNTGLTASTTYRYQVRARDAAGNMSAFSAAVTVTTSAGTGTGGCTATYSKTNEWGGGFQGAVTVTNTGTTATSAWTVVITFANGQRITQIWNARTSSTASPYTVINETYNNVIPANGTTSFGFLGSWTGTNANPTVTCTRTP